MASLDGCCNAKLKSILLSIVRDIAIEKHGGETQAGEAWQPLDPYAAQDPYT